MPFPFLWIGALVAAAFLTFMFMVFGLLMKLMNRATTEVRESILPGLVDGIRDWADDRRQAASQIVSPRSSEDTPTLDPTSGPTGIHLEPVHRAR